MVGIFRSNVVHVFDSDSRLEQKLFASELVERDLSESAVGAALEAIQSL
jgi:hypothetical protein